MTLAEGPSVASWYLPDGGAGAHLLWSPRWGRHQLLNKAPSCLAAGTSLTPSPRPCTPGPYMEPQATTAGVPGPEPRGEPASPLHEGQSASVVFSQASFPSACSTGERASTLAKPVSSLDLGKNTFVKQRWKWKEITHRQPRCGNSCYASHDYYPTCPLGCLPSRTVPWLACSDPLWL